MTLQDDLTSLVTQSSKSPELLYVAIVALGDEVERHGDSPVSLAKIRETARAVRQMSGMEADDAWRKLSRREKFRNRKREAEWKREFTDALILEAKSAVQAVVDAPR